MTNFSSFVNFSFEINEKNDSQESFNHYEINITFEGGVEKYIPLKSFKLEAGFRCG